MKQTGVQYLLQSWQNWSNVSAGKDLNRAIKSDVELDKYDYDET